MKYTAAYFLDYIARHMFLPGQVENWVVLVDLNDVSVMSAPINVELLLMKILKEVFAFMQNNFRGRLYKAYVLNAPWSFSTVYSGVKIFMEESTASKVVISSEKSEPTMLTHINLSQLESKFGGSASEIIKFWPPSLPQGDIFVESNPTKLIPAEEYKQQKASNKLESNKISPFI